MGLFDIDFGTFDPFCESVQVVCTSADGRSDPPRRATVSASVFVGESLASDAGARIHSVTGADFSVVIVRSRWPWAFRPAFGMFVYARGRRLAVQSVDEDEIAYTLRCTADERAEASV